MQTDAFASLIPTSAGRREISKERSILAESAASFFTVYLCLSTLLCSGIVASHAVVPIRVFTIALSYGLAHGCAVYAWSFPTADMKVTWDETRHISPIISMSLYLAGKQEFISTMLVYWIFQAIGALLGALAVLASISRSDDDAAQIWGYYEHPENVTVAMAFMMEMVATCVFVVVSVLFLFSGAEDSRPLGTHEKNSINTAFLLVCLNSAAGAVCGGFLNPYVLIAIGFLSSDWNRILLLIVAELTGGFLAAALINLYQFGTTPRKTQEVKSGEEGIDEPLQGDFEYD